MNESISPHATETPLSEERKADVSATASPEQFATTPNPGSHLAFRKPFLGSPVLWATAAILVLVGLLCLPGKRDSASGAPQPQLTEQLAEIKASFDELRDSLGDRTSGRVGNQPAERDAIRRNFAVEKARELEKAGDHEKAGYYWRNAVEHASDGELLSVLGEYAEAFFKAKTEDTDVRYAESATLERLAELALVRVPSEKMDAAFELRDKCAKFRSDFFAATAALPEDVPSEDDEPESAPGTVVRSVADSVAKLLAELETEVAGYEPGSGSDGSASETECRILQLSGVAESAMSQLWFLDRSGLDAAETKRISAFPKRLADAIEKFDEKHDAPLLADIQRLAGSNPPKTDSDAPHQRNVEFYTNQYAEATAEARKLRGTKAQTKAQEPMSGILKKVADEKRQQMNEYQKFVANSCKRSFDCYDPLLGATSLEYGRVPKKAGYKDEDDFIDRKIRSFSQSVSLGDLRSQTDWRKILANDTLVSQSLMTKSGGQAFFDVANHHKSFIILAINGMFRIDQSLLTPETSRMLNDVFNKFNQKMKPADQVKSVRWMVEEPKIRLEDF